MAILDQNKNKKPFLNDADEDVFIGFKLPLVLDNSYRALTTTTIDAVKVNLINFLSTELGERVMQPNLGIALKKFLFEPFSSEVAISIQNNIIENLGYWMPFIQINDIQIKMSDNEAGVGKNTMKVAIDFSLKKDPTTIESVQVNIGE